MLEELQLTQVLLIGITKGEGRKADLDTLYLSKRKRKIILPPDSPALHLTQQIRDEAHRFAITFHKKTKLKRDQSSKLLNTHGISQAKIVKLLQHFGTFDALQSATQEEIAAILNNSDAKKIKMLYK